MSRAAGLGILMLLAGCDAAAQAKPAETVVTPSCAPDGALTGMTIGAQRIELGQGATLDSPAVQDQIRKAVGRDMQQRIRVGGSLDLPYRCLGGLVFTLQRMGFGKVGFIAEPPPEDAAP